MKKILLFTFAAIITFHAFTQNVGIGTLTPQAKLEVNNPGMSAVKIRSNNYIDSSRLIFSNRNLSEQGTDMIISSNSESGLNVSSVSDLSYNNQPSIMTITPIGNVGLGQPLPGERLDVTGNINVTGTIKANGNTGSAGQYLSSNGTGGMSWTNSSFQNQVVYSVTSFPGTAADYNFTVPAGITKVQVEMWSAGGHGGYSNGYDSTFLSLTERFYTTGGGGGGGGYASALLTVIPAQVLAIHVPAGGEGGYAGVSSGANSIYMNNGFDGSNATGSGGSGGNFGGATGSFTNLYWLKGENGLYYTKAFNSFTFSSQVYRTYIYNYGDGGSSANARTRGVGGIRNEEIVENGASTLRNFIVRKGGNGGFPGGGGGGGMVPGDPGASGTYSYPFRGLGAGGMVIIRY